MAEPKSLEELLKNALRPDYWREIERRLRKLAERHRQIGGPGELWCACGVNLLEKNCPDAETLEGRDG